MSYLIFVDECGYSHNWMDEKNIEQQPFYVLSAVAIASSRVKDIYENIRKATYFLIQNDDAWLLGHGSEIKAKEVDRGEGIWGQNPHLRKEIRKIFLDLPETTFFVIIIDKKKHKVTYKDPKNPYELAFQFLFERVEGFLNDKNQYGLILIDLNKREEDAQKNTAAQLILQGSHGISWRNFYGQVYEWRLPINKIIELHFGDSRYSIGLQIADFVARISYSYLKNGRNPNYPGWSYIEQRLYKYPNHIGWGLKIFP